MYIGLRRESLHITKRILAPGLLHRCYFDIISVNEEYTYIHIGLPSFKLLQRPVSIAHNIR